MSDSIPPADYHDRVEWRQKIFPTIRSTFLASKFYSDLSRCEFYRKFNAGREYDPVDSSTALNIEDADLGEESSRLFAPSTRVYPLDTDTDLEDNIVRCKKDQKTKRRPVYCCEPQTEVVLEKRLPTRPFVKKETSTITPLLFASLIILFEESITDWGATTDFNEAEFWPTAVGIILAILFYLLPALVVLGGVAAVTRGSHIKSIQSLLPRYGRAVGVISLISIYLVLWTVLSVTTQELSLQINKAPFALSELNRVITCSIYSTQQGCQLLRTVNPYGVINPDRSVAESGKEYRSPWSSDWWWKDVPPFKSNVTLISDFTGAPLNTVNSPKMSESQSFEINEDISSFAKDIKSDEWSLDSLNSLVALPLPNKILQASQETLQCRWRNAVCVPEPAINCNQDVPPLHLLLTVCASLCFISYLMNIFGLRFALIIPAILLTVVLFPSLIITIGSRDLATAIKFQSQEPIKSERSTNVPAFLFTLQASTRHCVKLLVFAEGISKKFKLTESFLQSMILYPLFAPLYHLSVTFMVNRLIGLTSRIQAEAFKHCHQISPLLARIYNMSAYCGYFESQVVMPLGKCLIGVFQLVTLHAILINVFEDSQLGRWLPSRPRRVPRWFTAGFIPPLLFLPMALFLTFAGTTFQYTNNWRYQLDLSLHYSIGLLAAVTVTLRIVGYLWLYGLKMQKAKLGLLAPLLHFCGAVGMWFGSTLLMTTTREYFRSDDPSYEIKSTAREIVFYSALAIIACSAIMFAASIPIAVAHTHTGQRYQSRIKEAAWWLFCAPVAVLTNDLAHLVYDKGRWRRSGQILLLLGVVLRYSVGFACMSIWHEAIAHETHVLFPYLELLVIVFTPICLIPVFTFFPKLTSFLVSPQRNALRHWDVPQDPNQFRPSSCRGYVLEADKRYQLPFAAEMRPYRSSRVYDAERLKRFDMTVTMEHIANVEAVKSYKEPITVKEKTT
eukprot:GHVN01096023.1.p1 GENE.GHVN01096023.1~~GHVN01096023.1.p1  ORF type:complete len:957 (+),score=51.71 GHVN01096023.1:328-3198(+)